jgi:hypothetical protein
MSSCTTSVCAGGIFQKAAARLTGKPLVFMNSMGLQKMTFVPPSPAFGQFGAHAQTGRFRTRSPHELVDDHEAGVVPVAGILPAGIAEADHQPHRPHRQEMPQQSRLGLLALLLLLLGRGRCCLAGRCLAAAAARLGTTRLLGASGGAPAAPGAAPRWSCCAFGWGCTLGGTTAATASTFSMCGATTDATASLGSRVVRTPGGNFRSLAWRASPMSSAVTSSSILVGMASGLAAMGRCGGQVQVAAVGDADGDSGQHQRDADFDFLVHADADEVHVHGPARHRIDLHVANHGHDGF